MSSACKCFTSTIYMYRCTLLHCILKSSFATLCSTLLTILWLLFSHSESCKPACFCALSDNGCTGHSSWPLQDDIFNYQVSRCFCLCDDEIAALYCLSLSNEQSSKVKNYMLEILSSLMQEGESLSQEIIDIVLINIVEPAKVRDLAVVSSWDVISKKLFYLFSLTTSLCMTSPWNSSGKPVPTLNPISTW